MRSLLASAILGLYTGCPVSSHPHLPTPIRWRWNDFDRNEIRAPPHCRHSASNIFRLRNATDRFLSPSSCILRAIISTTRTLRHLATRLYNFLASSPRPHALELIPPSPIVAPIECTAPRDAKEEPPDNDSPLHLVPSSEIESRHTLRCLNDSSSSGPDHRHDDSATRAADFDLPIVLLQGSTQSLEEHSPPSPLYCDSAPSSSSLPIDRLAVDYYPSPPDSTLARPSRHSRKSADHNEPPPLELQVTCSTDGLVVFTLGNIVYRQLHGVMPFKSCATVYSAQNEATGQLVAIKLFTEAEPYRRQEQAALQCLSKNRRNGKEGYGFVIELLCAAERGSVQKFFITPLYKQDLFTYLYELSENLDVEVVRIWAAELLSALKFIHESDWAHRDLKPDNVLISQFDHVCITDFGLATRMTAENHRGVKIKGKESYVGTPGYYCPEMTDGSRRFIKLEAADVWGFGVIFLQMMMGSLCDLERAERDGWRVVLEDHRETIIEKEPVTYDLLSKILVNDPYDRYAIRDIRDHEFFEAIIWEALDKTATQPFPYLLLQVASRRLQLKTQRERNIG